MEYYRWVGIDKYGNKSKGIMRVENEIELGKRLKQSGIALLSFHQAFGPGGLHSILNGQFFLKAQNILSLDSLLWFFENFTILLEEGIQLVPALLLLKEQAKEKKPLQYFISAIYGKIIEGKKFSQALLSCGNIVFSPFIIGMIVVGEETGQFVFILKKLIEFLRFRHRLIKDFKKAVLLPLITLLFALFIVCLIFVFVIPQFEVMFSSMEKPVPFLTLFVFKLSHLFRSFYFWGVGFLLFFVLFWLFTHLRNNFLKKLSNELKNLLPGWKLIREEIDLTIFLQIIALMLEAGILLKNALLISLEAVSSSDMKKKIKMMYELLLRGNSFSCALEKVGGVFVRDSLVSIAKVGEETGQMAFVLKRYALSLQQKVERKLNFFSIVVQPILLILIGLLIAIVMLAIYSPLLDMSNIFS